jgi:hypothetical protein
MSILIYISFGVISALAGHASGFDLMTWQYWLVSSPIIILGVMLAVFLTREEE